MNRLITATMVALAVGAAGCGADEPASTGSITITEPAAGATVSSPVEVAVTSSGITIEPAGTPRAGAGHVHIMVDTECVAVGSSVPKDDTHIHLGDGSSSTSVELAPGAHTLCVQMADGEHIALDATSTVTFTVE